jgi:hypothetical protein
MWQECMLSKATTLYRKHAGTNILFKDGRELSLDRIVSLKNQEEPERMVLDGRYVMAIPVCGEALCGEGYYLLADEAAA